MNESQVALRFELLSMLPSKLEKLDKTYGYLASILGGFTIMTVLSFIYFIVHCYCTEEIHMSKVNESAIKIYLVISTIPIAIGITAGIWE